MRTIQRYVLIRYWDVPFVISGDVMYNVGNNIEQLKAGGQAT